MDNNKTSQTQSSRDNLKNNEDEEVLIMKRERDSDSEEEVPAEIFNKQVLESMLSEGREEMTEFEQLKAATMSRPQIIQINLSNAYQRGFSKLSETGSEGLRAYRKSTNGQMKRVNILTNGDKVQLKDLQTREAKPAKSLNNELPTLINSKLKPAINLSTLSIEMRLLRKGASLKEDNLIYF